MTTRRLRSAGLLRRRTVVPSAADAEQVNTVMMTVPHIGGPSTPHGSAAPNAHQAAGGPKRQGLADEHPWSHAPIWAKLVRPRGRSALPCSSALRAAKWVQQPLRPSTGTRTHTGRGQCQASQRCACQPPHRGRCSRPFIVSSMVAVRSRPFHPRGFLSAACKRTGLTRLAGLPCSRAPYIVERLR